MVPARFRSSLLVLLLGCSTAPGAESGGGGASDGAPASSDAASLDGGGSSQAGCADGFTRCGRLCIDQRLVTDSCTPRACSTPPGHGAPGPTSRAFAHELTVDGSGARFTFSPGPASPVLPATIAVDVHVRVDGGALRTVAMAHDAGSWLHLEPDVADGQVLEYYFTQTMGPNSFHPASPGGNPRVDSAWFQRVAGQPAEATADHTLTVAARFRDRHRNEWRYDHYVAGYDDGAIYTMTLTDRGTAVDVVVTPDPAAEVGKVDLKWYETFGPTPFCHDPPALAGLAAPGGMERAGNVFSYTIDGVTPGQQLEFELTFTDRPGGLPTYYSEWFHYYVGTGELGQRTQDPRAYAAGASAVSDVTVHQFGYAQHLPMLGEGELRDFITGKILFETDFASGRLFNPPTAYDCAGGAVNVPPRDSPRAADYAGELGPAYDASSCIGCHHLDGRGQMPDGLIIKLVPTDPVYGDQLSQRGAAEGRLVIDYELVDGQFADGTPYQLRRPVYRLSELSGGPATSGISVRLAPAVFGGGLLEAVPDAVLDGLADPDDLDGDGISGTRGDGRFGWRATQPTVRAQTAAAFAGDMGLTTAELDADDIDRVADYVGGLSVPPRVDATTPAAAHGKELFESAGCGGCHVPHLLTDLDYPTASVAGQVIQPFTDLLLHDMGEDLADAGGREWRTPPLWGLGYAGKVATASSNPSDPNGDTPPAHFLHDGRARSIMEAILWHGGEAATARDRVLSMSAGERADLVTYVRDPFADLLPVPVCAQ